MSSSYYRVRTQKAKGILGLVSGNARLPMHLSSQAVARSVVLMWDMEQVQEGQEYFARPCPIRPRHGFVESRLVRTAADLEKVLVETFREDEDGEIVLMPPIEAGWSAVGTPSVLSLGPGNDGVTSGKATVSIPTHIPSMSAMQTWAERYTKFGLTGEDFPYFEMVNGCWGEAAKAKPPALSTEVVQVRAGPEIPSGGKNYIPREVKIEQTLSPKAGEDLLSWEKRVWAARKECPEGLVIYLPGLSLASHWAVHGIQNGLPVLTDTEKLGISSYLFPEALWGKVFEPEVFERPVPSAEELKELAGLMDEFPFSWSHPNPQEALLVSLLTLHHSMLWGWGPVENRIRAAGVRAAMALALLACLGELRHWWRAGPGRKQVDPPFKMEFFKEKTLILDRQVTYAWLLHEMNWHTAAPLLPGVIEGFKGEWNSSYGGTKWKTCASRTRRLWEAVRIFQKGPTLKRWERVIHYLNMLVNTSHNGGRLLSKWVSEDLFSSATCRPYMLISGALGAAVGLPSPNWSKPAPATDLLKGASGWGSDGDDDDVPSSYLPGCDCEQCQKLKKEEEEMDEMDLSSEPFEAIGLEADDE